MSARASTSADRPPPAAGSLGLLFGGIAVYVFVWNFLEPPPTWTRCSQPSPSELIELNAQRQDFLPIAVPLVTAYAVLVAVYAWKWAADRRARQGHGRRPGRVALGMTLAYGVAWAFLIPYVFTAESAFGAAFWGLILAAAGVVLGVASAGRMLVVALFGRTRRWSDVVDELSVGLTWSILLFGIPLFLILIGMVGKDATFVC